LHVVVEDLEHFSRFLLDHLLNDSGVADVNSSFVLRTVKQERALPLRHLAAPRNAARSPGLPRAAKSARSV
ncbi:MAG TPA: Lrp/AsnC ligand binding domain-containing protein, partial [Xanthomonadaceae bacterium]|nr:Lrp/AsnC ligand binding domain-containing protein [Xanthomonadaceae bacterium]